MKEMSFEICVWHFKRENGILAEFNSTRRHGPDSRPCKIWRDHAKCQRQALLTGAASASRA